MSRSSINILVLANSTPTKARWADVLNGLDTEGAAVALATYRDLPRDYPQPAAMHALIPASAGHGPGFRRIAGAAKPAKRLSLYAQHDDWLRGQARTSQIIFALDKDARPAARKLAGKHAVVVTSIKAALTQLRAAAPETTPVRPTEPSMTERARSRALTLPPGLIALLLYVPRISDRTRYRFARDAALNALHRTQPERAEQIFRVGLKRIASPRLRADLLGDIVCATLANGDQPALAKQAYAAELAIADSHLAAGSYDAAAASVAEAARTIFHRVLHFDGLTSPLAEDPIGFTAPWHASGAAAALCAPRGRRAPAAMPPTDRPLRLLIGTWANANFLAEIIDYFDQHPGVDVRFVDFAKEPGLKRLARQVEGTAQHIFTPNPADTEQLEAHLRPHLDWADIVFVEWCAKLAVLMTLVDPADTRVIVRLHSQEAFIQWPHLVDFSRVDDVVFVSEHLRDLATAAIPAIGAGLHTHVLSNALALRPLAREKPDNARFTMGLIGWSQVAKDPRWAIDVLRILHRRDPRYRLALIGSPLHAGLSGAAHDYAMALDADFAELSDSIDLVGHTDDIAGALQGIGVILSSSVRESFHAGLIEGAASGAVPIVRDWPFFAGRPNSARTLFPSEWVVATPEEAAQRILSVTSSDDVWRAAGRSAADTAIARWDWNVVQHGYENLILGGSSM